MFTRHCPKTSLPRRPRGSPSCCLAFCYHVWRVHTLTSSSYRNYHVFHPHVPRTSVKRFHELASLETYDDELPTLLGPVESCYKQVPCPGVQDHCSAAYWAKCEQHRHWGQGPKYPPGTCWIHWEYRQQVTPMCPVGIGWVHFKCPLPWDSNLPRPEHAGYI